MKTEYVAPVTTQSIKNHIDWENVKEFEILLDKYRRKDGRWDVIVPCSGGKDSGSLAHRLKYEYGMHPLCLTWSPLLYTNIGMNNFQNMNLSGLDSYLFSPIELYREKSQNFVLSCRDHLKLLIAGQWGIILSYSLKGRHKINYVWEMGILNTEEI